MINETRGENLILVAVNEYLINKSVKYEVTSFIDDSLVAKGEVTIEANDILDIAEIIPDSQNNFYFIEWEVDGKTYKNHYVSGPAPYDFDTYVSWLKRGDLLQTQGF